MQREMAGIEPGLAQLGAFGLAASRLAEGGLPTGGEDEELLGAL